MHDLGRVAVHPRIWDKTARLTAGECEQVRLHAYHTERVLSPSPAFAHLGFGWLAWRSGYVPRVLAALLAVAGVGYAFDSVAVVLVGHAAPTIAVFTFLGEVLLAVWLIVWSRRIPRGQAGSRGAHE